MKIQIQSIKSKSKYKGGLVEDFDMRKQSTSSFLSSGINFARRMSMKITGNRGKHPHHHCHHPLYHHHHHHHQLCTEDKPEENWNTRYLLNRGNSFLL